MDILERIDSYLNEGLSMDAVEKQVKKNFIASFSVEGDPKYYIRDRYDFYVVGEIVNGKMRDIEKKDMLDAAIEWVGKKAKNAKLEIK